MRALLKRPLRKLQAIKAISDETEQALIRVVFVSLITLYLLINHSSPHAVLLCAAYLVCSILMLLNILQNPQKNEQRQWVAMLLDICATTAEQMISGPLAGMFVGIYLWLIIGYGLRYGAKFFKGCYVFSLIGFGITLYLNPYWNAHQHLAYGFLLTMLLIPLHTLRLQINLEKAIRRADMANEAKSNFLSNISHEMRTPLNGIIGATELLSQTRLGEKQQALLQMADSSAHALKKLINDVLDISKIENGKIDLERQAFYLPDMLQQFQTLFQLEVERKRLWLHMYIDPALRRSYMGSVKHIEQVLTNLIANAIKFTQQGGVDVIVKLKHSYPGLSMVAIEVKDTGIGIKAEALPYIFDRFTQADHSISKRYGGTGLGTTISKQLVELMGGKISVMSQEGVGSSFIIELPLEHNIHVQGVEINPALAMPAGGNVVRLSSHSKYRKKLRVLVADDNVVNRMILTEVLQKQRCVVKAVDNGDAALDALEKHHFDLMVLDYTMPEMTGLEVFNIYHALPGSKPVTAVILTADATKSTHDRCLRAGVFKVLTKPVISRQIQAMIQEVEASLSVSEQPAKTAADTAASPHSGGSHTASTTHTSDYQEPLLDQERLSHLIKLGDGESFLHTLITEFIESTDLLVRDLRNQCLDLQLEQAHKLAHALAGESANLGLMPLSKHSRTLMGLTMDDAATVSQRYQNVLTVYEATREQLLLHRSKLNHRQSNH